MTYVCVVPVVPPVAPIASSRHPRAVARQPVTNLRMKLLPLVDCAAGPGPAVVDGGMLRSEALECGLQRGDLLLQPRDALLELGPRRAERLADRRLRCGLGAAEQLHVALLALAGPPRQQPDELALLEARERALHLLHREERVQALRPRPQLGRRLRT